MTSSLRFLFTTAALSLCVVACSRKAPTVQAYQNNGVQFSYYSDWKIAKDAPVEAKPNVRSILLKGPNHAVVTLICVPPSSTQTLEQYAQVVAGMRKTNIENRLSVGSVKTANVDRGTSEPVTGKVAGRDQTGIHQQYSTELLGHAVLHDVNFFVLRGTQYKVMIMSQVPQEHSQSSRPGIELIVDSLRIEGLQ